MRFLVFLLGFVIVSILSNVADSIVLTMGDKETAFYEWFLMLLVSGTPIGVVEHVSIYGFYYMLSVWITAKTSPLVGNCAIVIIGLLYILAVTLCDYYFFPRYASFGQYFSNGSHFFLYACSAVITCIAIRALSKRKNRQKDKIPAPGGPGR